MLVNAVQPKQYDVHTYTRTMLVKVAKSSPVSSSVTMHGMMVWYGRLPWPRGGGGGGGGRGGVGRSGAKCLVQHYTPHMVTKCIPGYEYYSMHFVVVCKYSTMNVNSYVSCESDSSSG